MLRLMLCCLALLLSRMLLLLLAVRGNAGVRIVDKILAEAAFFGELSLWTL